MVSITIILGLVVLLCITSIFSSNVHAKLDMLVHNVNTGLNYATIQEAIDAPQTLDSHVIYVEPGIYYENVIIKKAIALIGNNATIDGGRNGNVIHLLDVNNVTVAGFVIKNSSREKNGGQHTSGAPHSGIYIEFASSCNISNNVIEDNYVGVYTHVSYDNLIEGNKISSNEQIGLRLGTYTGNTTIHRNVISYNNRGVEIYSNENILTENSINSNNDVGIQLAGHNNILANNTISNNGGHGLSLDTCDNTLVVRNFVAQNEGGLIVSGSRNSSFVQNTIFSNGAHGIVLNYSGHNLLKENAIRYHCTGIHLEVASENILSGNFVKAGSQKWSEQCTHACIFLTQLSDKNTLTGNVVSEGKWGIKLERSNDNILTNNSVSLQLAAIDLAWSHRNIVLGNNVSCDNEFLSDGIQLWYSNHNDLTGNNIFNSYRGIFVRVGQFNTFSNNNITANQAGIFSHEDAHENSFSRNKITANNVGLYILGLGNSFSTNQISNNSYGIYVESTENLFVSNYVSNNHYGVVLNNASDNKFYHNNFVNNTEQVIFEEILRSNEWDNGAEGNYWSDYLGVDWDHNGIGDNPHVLNYSYSIQDIYPLMEPWSNARIFSVETGDRSHIVVTESNCTVSGFICSITTTQISFNVTGPDNEKGFCRITIPVDLFYAPETQWVVTIDKDEHDPEVSVNASHTTVYLDFNLSSHTIEITILRVTPHVWTHWWFWLILGSLSVCVCSYLLVRFKKKRTVYEEVQKLTRQYVRGRISRAFFEREIDKLVREVDIETGQRIKEYLPHMIAYESAIWYAEHERNRTS